MTVGSTTIISDAVKFIRDDLSSNITDPISSVRNTSGKERFVMTSYPLRPVRYPIITVRAKNIKDSKRLGMASQRMMVSVPIEVRVWARNEVEKDTLTEQVYNWRRQHQLGAGSSTVNGLFDQLWASSVDVDEPEETGQGTIKSKVMEFNFKFVTDT